MTEPARTVLVTGSNRGIGLATCELLAENDYRVFLGSRDATRGDRAAAALQSKGLSVQSVHLDLCDPDSVHRARAQLVDQGIRLDALVNNAGVALDGFDAKVVRNTMAVNVHGVMRVTEALLAVLSKQACIVMVSSGMGELSGFSDKARRRFDNPLPTPQGIGDMLEQFEEAVQNGSHKKEGWPSSAYQVSKAALNAYARWLAQEQPGLRINAVCPGWVRTDMGGSGAPRSPRAAAEGIVWAATLGPDGPTGGFFRDGVSIPW